MATGLALGKPTVRSFALQQSQAPVEVIPWMNRVARIQ